MPAEADVLRDEAEAYADRLRVAGVPVVGIRALGMTHAFFNFLGTSPAARSLLNMAARELGERLSAGIEPTGSRVLIPGGAVSDR